MYLRQSTASQEILLGPFLDDADGVTAETGLTVANTDLKLWKGGATSEASKNSGGATHIAAGRYYAVLDATDTDTVGMLEVNAHVSGALPVKARFYVLEEAVYDALFAASAPGYVDGATVNATKIGGTSQTGRDIGASVLLSNGTGTGQIVLNSGVPDARLADAVSHGGTLGSSTATLALSRVNVTSQTSNTSALTLTGNGTGHGATLGSGSGATGNALTLTANSTNGHGLKSTGAGTGDGAELTAGASGADLDADIAGTLTTVTTLTNAPSDSSGVTTLLSRIGGALTITSGRVNADLTHINATSVAGTSTRVADAFVTLLNVASPVLTVASVNQTGDNYARLGAPAGASVSADVAAVKSDTGNLVTRITSTLFSGITSLAQWLGLIAGKQTGNSTARTEIRATGAGSGTFDETTDSVEAIRDRGDAAWTTATGFSTLDASGVRTAVGLASANLDTQIAAVKSDTAAVLDDTGTSGVVVASGSKSGYALSSSGLDAVLVESSISAGASLVNDSGTQLTSINARQALALALSALDGVLAGAATTTITTKPAGKPSASARITATVDADGNRSALTLRTPD